MSTADWHLFDYEHKNETRPPDSSLVWINEVFYHGVTLGFYDGWWRHWTGSDDISVTHWAPLAPPDAP